ncbi:MAG: DNA replication and repair protein RecF [Muribaculaceae bacterium]|nr:DNA replication and repair protein RecF [Muribaculaceae bacterium]
MILESLSATNFKNIGECSLEFSPKINCFLGNNGMGKSNLLDAVYYLSFTKSFTRVPDAMLIRNGETFGILAGKYERHGADELINVGFRQGARKSFKRGGKEYKRISTHIGLFPTVMVAPADSALVTDSAEERRRFIDMIISQADAPYLDALMRYNQCLEHRNKLLRDGVTDEFLYESLEGMMDADARLIEERRQEYVKDLAVEFASYYSQIASEAETVEIGYIRNTAAYPTPAKAWNDLRARDTILKYTSKGPHRDDISFSVCGLPARQTASQGQTKTLTIALRLAQYSFLKRITGHAPLLLLDDIFDKLDADRVARIMEIVSRDDFGQIFITDTNRKHLDEILRHTGPDYRMWHVDNGSFTPIKADETC